MVWSVKVQGAHQVDIVRVQSRLAQECRKDIFNKPYALFGCVYLFRVVPIERYKAVPNVTLVFLCPRFHFVYRFLGYHAVLIEYARTLLQVFECREFFVADALAFRCYVVVHILLARHIVKGAGGRVLVPLIVACFF